MNAVAINQESKELAKVLAENVRRLLDKSGMTRAALSEATGLNRQFIWEVLKGEHIANFVDVKRIADAFNVSMDSLLAEPRKQRIAN